MFSSSHLSWTMFFVSIAMLNFSSQCSNHDKLLCVITLPLLVTERAYRVFSRMGQLEWNLYLLLLKCRQPCAVFNCCDLYMTFSWERAEQASVWWQILTLSSNNEARTDGRHGSPQDCTPLLFVYWSVACIEGITLWLWYKDATGNVSRDKSMVLRVDW